MIYNILAINKNIYVKASLLNINTFHRFKSDQEFKLYLDKDTFAYYNTIKDKLLFPDKVSTKIFESTDQEWQYYKVEIFKDYYQKDDYVILDADSIWISVPEVSEEKITFLNLSNRFKDGNQKFFGSMMPICQLDESINGETGNYQMGFLAIPKKFHYDNIVEDWMSLTKLIKTAPFLHVGYQRQCEQLAISIITQKKYPDDFTTLEGKYHYRHDIKYLVSLYFSCRQEGELEGMLVREGWRN